MMLVEVRKILFPIEDLKTSLLEECSFEGLKVPNSQIQSIKIDGEESPKVTLQFMTAHEKSPLEVKLSQQFVLSAMVHTCMSLNVPLPRYSDKSYKKHEKGLGLIVTLGITKMNPAHKTGT